jgi:hypothetical protein
VLAPTGWKLRRALRSNEILGSLRLEKHPDKSFIGRIERGFDFLDYHFRCGACDPRDKRSRVPRTENSARLRRLSGCLRGPLEALV